MQTSSVAQFEEVSTPGVRRRIYTDESATKDYLDGLLAEVLKSRAVEHPFLDWYSHNRLSKAQERVLFLECYYWFRQLPFYIAGMSTITRDARVLKELMLNVLDEVGEEKTHAELYVEFLGRIGIPVEQALAYEPSEATKALNAGMERLYQRPPVERALGALFFDEAMSAIMVGKVNDGLRNQGYDAKTRWFWELHVEVEKGHSNSVFNAIFPHAECLETQRLFESGLHELEGLVESFWDSVQTLVTEAK